MPVFKIKFGEDTRRISLDRAPSFDELKQIVKQLFNISQPFILKYEDEEKDLITIASDGELNEALLVASKHFSNLLRLSVIDQAHKPNNEPQITPEVFRSEFTKAVNGSAQDVSNLLSKFQTLGIPQTPQQSGQQSLQVLSQLMTTFPWLNDTIAAMVKQSFQIPTPTQPSQCAPNTPQSNAKACPSPVSSPANKKHRHMAKFIKDVSVADGTTLAPETKFVKTWRVRNDGVAAWPENTMLSYVGGDQLGTSSVVSVPPVEAGQEVEISVSMLAPSLPGRYNSFWRLCGPDGSKFGHRMWADITVKASQPMAESLTQQEVVDSSVGIVVAGDANKRSNDGSSDVVISNNTTDTSVESDSSNNNAPKDTINADNATKTSEASTTPAEAEALVTLVDMGFKGDLLSLLRKHGGDLMNTLGELVTRH